MRISVRSLFLCGALASALLGTNLTNAGQGEKKGNPKSQPSDAKPAEKGSKSDLEARVSKLEAIVQKQANSGPKSDPKFNEEVLKELRSIKCELQRLSKSEAKPEPKPQPDSPPERERSGSPLARDDGFAPSPSGGSGNTQGSALPPCNSTERSRSASNDVIIRRRIVPLEEALRWERGSDLLLDREGRFAQPGTYTIPATRAATSLPSSRIALDANAAAFPRSVDSGYSIPLRTELQTTSDWLTGHYNGRTFYTTPSTQRAYVIPRNADVVLEPRTWVYRVYPQ